jgi:hypothetical protein
MTRALVLAKPSRFRLVRAASTILCLVVRGGFLLPRSEGEAFEPDLERVL